MPGLGSFPSYGGSHHGSGSLRLCVRTILVLTLFLKQGTYENHPGYHYFFQGKKIRFSDLVVLSNSRIAGFLVGSHKLDLKKINLFF